MKIISIVVLGAGVLSLVVLANSVYQDARCLVSISVAYVCGALSRGSLSLVLEAFSVQWAAVSIWFFVKRAYGVSTLFSGLVVLFVLLAIVSSTLGLQQPAPQRGYVNEAGSAIAQ